MSLGASTPAVGTRGRPRSLVARAGLALLWTLFGLVGAADSVAPALALATTGFISVAFATTAEDETAAADVRG